MMSQSQNPVSKPADIESGTTNRDLYPKMSESPELRWSFIRKVYSILSVQLLLTVAVGAFVVSQSHHPIAVFLTTTKAGMAICIVLAIVPLIIICPLYCYRQRHPVNYILLVFFTLCMSFSLGLACSFKSGKVILEAAILTAVVVVSLTLFTFWAAKRGYDFNFLGPFLFGAIMVFIVFGIIQICFPFGKISVMIFGCLGAILFCAYIVFDTDQLIKRYTYDDYIWAAVSLYIDILNLFMSLLMIFGADD